MENQEEKMIVEYQTQQGDLMRLTMNMVRKYLVAGKNELVTEQELVFFMHTCKARKLNPFLKDCHLVKYDNSPAAIITSIDYHRKNVRKAKDCKGWTSGIVVKKEDGSVEYREGTLIFPNEILVGGWSEAQPEGWPKPKRWTVNLETYIKRKTNGEITQFWQPAKQPDMIAKVAEVQLLRQLWGEESTGMYTPEEMPSLEDAELSRPIVEIKEVIKQEEKAAQDLEEKLKSKPFDLSDNNKGKHADQISDIDAEQDQNEISQSDKDEQEARNKLDPTHFDRYKHKRDPLKVIEYFKAFANKFFARPDRMTEAKEWFERRFKDHIFPLSIDKSENEDSQESEGKNKIETKEKPTIEQEFLQAKAQISAVRDEDPKGLAKISQITGISMNPPTIQGCDKLLEEYWKMKRGENRL